MADRREIWVGLCEAAQDPMKALAAIRMALHDRDLSTPKGEPGGYSRS